ncbi:hypothetical protein PJV90_11190, partial [Aliarcobacter butzleri]|uniref:hypothetical protein n=1 Tax=Aliarcobacter butzleri TaxID=28197 RepID=UPI00263F10E7
MSLKEDVGYIKNELSSEEKFPSHIPLSQPTGRVRNSYGVLCLKKKKKYMNSSNRIDNTHIQILKITFTNRSLCTSKLYKRVWACACEHHI